MEDGKDLEPYKRINKKLRQDDAFSCVKHLKEY
jgi:hypothetical protein